MTQFHTFHADGSPLNDGAADLQDAAHTMLTYDGHDFEIRHEDGEFKLFVSRFSQNSCGGKHDLVEWPKYSAKSEAEVFANVIKMGGVNDYYAMTAAEYAEMVAEAEAA